MVSFLFGPISSSTERQLQLLCAVYDGIRQDAVPRSCVLQAMTERVLLPLVSHCSPAALVDFFVANVTDVMALLLSRFTKVRCSVMQEVSTATM